MKDLADALVGCECRGVRSSDLEGFLSRLPARWRDVLCMRFGIGMERKTLGGMAALFGVSREWARMLEAKALIRVRMMLDEAYYMVEHRKVFAKRPPSGRDLMVAEIDAGVCTITSGQAAYITGFFEGDGSVTEHSSNYFVLRATQVESAILEYIRGVVGGGMLRCVRPVQGVQRYVLVYARGAPREIMLRVLANHVVSPQFLVKLNRALGAYGMSEAVLHEPTIDWLAGFFDAEGCAFSSGRHCGHWLTIGQKERGVLEKIQVVFGGKVYGPRKDGVSEWRLMSGGEMLSLANDLWLRSHSPKRRANLEALMTRLKVDEGGKLLGLP